MTGWPRETNRACSRERRARRRPDPRGRHAPGRRPVADQRLRRPAVAGDRGRRGLRRPDAVVAEELCRQHVRHQRQAGPVRRDGVRPRGGLRGGGCPRRAAPYGGARRVRRGRRAGCGGGAEPSGGPPARRPPDAGRHARGSLGADHPAGAGARAEESRDGFDRRRLLLSGAGIAAVAATTAAIGQGLGGRASAVAQARADVTVPPVPTPVVVPPAASLHVPGITPYVVPNRDFYRIDTALVVPQMDTRGWRLRVHGLVDQEVEIDCDDLGVQADAAGAGHPDLRLQRGRRRPRRQRRLDRAGRSASCWPWPGHSPEPTWCSRRASTASPPARRSRRSPTTATRCWPWP